MPIYWKLQFRSVYYFGITKKQLFISDEKGNDSTLKKRWQHMYFYLEIFLQMTAQQNKITMHHTVQCSFIQNNLF